jgi:hypothetical protein
LLQNDPFCLFYTDELTMFSLNATRAEGEFGVSAEYKSLNAADTFGSEGVFAVDRAQVWLNKPKNYLN